MTAVVPPSASLAIVALLDQMDQRNDRIAGSVTDRINNTDCPDVSCWSGDNDRCSLNGAACWQQNVLTALTGFFDLSAATCEAPDSLLAPPSGSPCDSVFHNSTVHIPTDFPAAYSLSDRPQLASHKFICATRDLEETLAMNYVNGYQDYITNEFGVNRAYPGYAAPMNGMFCNDINIRERPWFKSVFTGTKNVLVLLDETNSMEKCRGCWSDVCNWPLGCVWLTAWSYAKEAVNAILDTIHEDDNFAVMRFSVGDDNSLLGTSSTLLPGTESNIESVRAVVASRTHDPPPGFLVFPPPLDYSFHMNAAFDLLATTEVRCHNVIIVLTDELPQVSDHQLIETHQVALQQAGHPRARVILNRYQPPLDSADEPTRTATCSAGNLFALNLAADGTPHHTNAIDTYYDVLAELTDTTAHWSVHTVDGEPYVSVSRKLSPQVEVTGSLLRYVSTESHGSVATTTEVPLRVLSPDTDWSNPGHLAWLQQEIRNRQACAHRPEREMDMRLHAYRSRTSGYVDCDDSATVAAPMSNVQPTWTGCPAGLTTGAAGALCTPVLSLSGKCCTESTPQPTSEPTIEPTPEPTADPTVLPTAEPTSAPTSEPTSQPTSAPTSEPTFQPTSEPTSAPTSEPTSQPTSAPTSEPTSQPTSQPTSEHTLEPTFQPTSQPTSEPTSEPTTEPTSEPTSETTSEPTTEPTFEPTSEPTSEPTAVPTHQQTREPFADSAGGDSVADGGTAADGGDPTDATADRDPTDDISVGTGGDPTDGFSFAATGGDPTNPTAATFSDPTDASPTADGDQTDPTVAAARDSQNSGPIESTSISRQPSELMTTPSSINVGQSDDENDHISDKPQHLLWLLLILPLLLSCCAVLILTLLKRRRRKPQVHMDQDNQPSSIILSPVERQSTHNSDIENSDLAELHSGVVEPGSEVTSSDLSSHTLSFSDLVVESDITDSSDDQEQPEMGGNNRIRFFNYFAGETVVADGPNCTLTNKKSPNTDESLSSPSLSMSASLLDL